MERPGLRASERTLMPDARSQVPFLDVAAAYREQKAELDAAAQQVFGRGRYVLGPELEAFEAEFAALHGVGHGIGVGNGLDALVLALRALGIGPGDRVLVPAHTFIATWLAVSYAGAEPVPVEVDPVTFNMTPEACRGAMTPGVRAPISCSTLRGADVLRTSFALMLSMTLPTARRSTAPPVPVTTT